MEIKDYNRLRRHRAKELSKQRENMRNNKKNEYREAHEEDWHTLGDWD